MADGESGGGGRGSHTFHTEPDHVVEPREDDPRPGDDVPDGAMGRQEFQRAYFPGDDDRRKKPWVAPLKPRLPDDEVRRKVDAIIAGGDISEGDIEYAHQIFAGLEAVRVGRITDRRYAEAVKIGEVIVKQRKRVVALERAQAIRDRKAVLEARAKGAEANEKEVLETIKAAEAEVREEEKAALARLEKERAREIDSLKEVVQDPALQRSYTKRSRDLLAGIRAERALVLAGDLQRAAAQAEANERLEADEVAANAVRFRERFVRAVEQIDAKYSRRRELAREEAALRLLGQTVKGERQLALAHTRVTNSQRQLAVLLNPARPPVVAERVSVSGAKMEEGGVTPLPLPPLPEALVRRATSQRRRASSGGNGRR